LSEGKDELASSIAGLRAAAPSDARLAAIAERLASAGAPVGDGDAPVSTRVPKPERAPLIRLKTAVDSGVLAVVLALVVGAALVTGALFLRSTPETAPVTPPPASSAATGTRQEAPAVPTAPPSATTPSDNSLPTGTDHERTTHPTPDDGTGTGPSGSATAPSTPSLTATTPSATAASTSSPTATPLARPLGAPTKSSAPSSHASTSRAIPSAPSTPTEAPLAAGAPVVSEVELLKQARSALSADPLQAFTLTEQCRSRYPDGSFVQEREYIAIVALARLGRIDEARSRASLFRMHYKNSAYLPRLGTLLGEP
jgi:hypothetical protein